MTTRSICGDALALFLTADLPAGTLKCLDNAIFPQSAFHPGTHRPRGQEPFLLLEIFVWKWADYTQGKMKDEVGMQLKFFSADCKIDIVTFTSYEYLSFIDETKLIV